MLNRSKKDNDPNINEPRMMMIKAMPEKERIKILLLIFFKYLDKLF